MLAGLFLALILIFSGGYEAVMLNPEMKKNVKSTVHDKVRKKQINKILKEITHDQKQFSKKTLKPRFKELEKLNLEYDSKLENYEILFNDYYTSLEELQIKYLDAEIKIRTLTKEDEWNQMMEKVIQKPEKEKHQNQIKKLGEQINTNLLKAIESNITDTNNLKKAIILLNDYQLNTTTLVEKILEMTYKKQESIRKYDTPRADFELLVKDIMDGRKEYMSFVVNMLFQLKELTPVDNWEKVAKAINQNLSKAGS